MDPTIPTTEQLATPTNHARQRVAMALQYQRGLQKPTQMGNMANDLLQVWNMNRAKAQRPVPRPTPPTPDVQGQGEGTAEMLGGLMQRSLRGK